MMRDIPSGPNISEVLVLSKVSPGNSQDLAAHQSRGVRVAHMCLGLTCRTISARSSVGWT